MNMESASGMKLMRSLVFALDSAVATSRGGETLRGPILNLLTFVRERIATPWILRELLKFEESTTKIRLPKKGTDFPEENLLTDMNLVINCRPGKPSKGPGKPANKKSGLKGNFENLWNQALANARRAKKSFCVLIDFLFRRMAFRNKDLESVTWSRTWQQFQAKYSLLWFFGLSTKWLKYQIACVFARAACQELPDGLEGEIPGMFLSGVGYVFLNHIVNDHSSRGVDLAHNFLMSKKGLPEVHPYELVKAKRDCLDTLSTERQERIIEVPRYVALTGLPMEGPDERKPAPECKCTADVLKQDSRTGEFRLGPVRRCESCLLEPIAPRYPINFPCDLPQDTLQTLEEYETLTYASRLGHLVQQVRRTAEEVFRGKRSQTTSVPIPSLKAHFESGRPQGGAYAALVEMLKEKYEADYKNNVGYNRQNRLYPVRKYLTNPRCPYFSVCWNCSLLCTSFALESSVSDSIDLISSSPWSSRVELEGGVMKRVVTCDDHNECIRFDGDRVKRCVEDFFRDLESTVLSTQNIVEPVALPEPLKVRVITKGPVTRYFLGKFIQKFTWSVMKEHPTFKVIGTPLTEELLEERLGLLSEGEVYQSADYKSATDYLHPDLSATAAFEIGAAMGWGDHWLQMYVDGLTNSYLCDGRPQRWGQLMGSPLSFPILCLVNAALNRFFLELSSGKALSLRECPMLINGDDVAMKMKLDRYENWKRMVTDGGLVPSIGKNYVSSHFVIMNSTLYESLGESLLGRANFQRRPYLNLALICPRIDSKVQKDLRLGAVSIDPAVKDLSQLAHKGLEGLDFEQQDWAMSKFLGWEEVKKYLKCVPGRVSWFADKCLGGIGLPVTRDDLMTPEQQGYYTRRAGLFGVDDIGYTPTCDIGGGAGWCLLELTGKRKLWGDWFLPSQAFSVPAPTGELWKAALRDSDPSTINDRIAEKTRMRLEIESDAFRPHKHAWPIRTLARFPWTYCAFEEFGPEREPHVWVC